VCFEGGHVKDSGGGKKTGTGGLVGGSKRTKGWNGGEGWFTEV